MKKIQIIPFIFLVLSLKMNAQENEVFISKIDKEIKSYEEKTSVKKTSKEAVNGIVVETIWYKKKGKINKIENNFLMPEGYKMETSIYLKKGKLIKQKNFGFTPVIRKGIEEKTNACCLIIDYNIYFINEDKVVQKDREVKLFSVEKYTEEKDKLLDLPYKTKELSAEESKIVYDRIKNIANRLQ